MNCGSKIPRSRFTWSTVSNFRVKSSRLTDLWSNWKQVLHRLFISTRSRRSFQTRRLSSNPSELTQNFLVRHNWEESRQISQEIPSFGTIEHPFSITTGGCRFLALWGIQESVAMRFKMSRLDCVKIRVKPSQFLSFIGTYDRIYCQQYRLG